MKVKGKVTAVSRRESDHSITIAVDTGEMIEINLTPEGYERHKDHLAVGGEIAFETTEEPQWVWGKLPRIPE